MAGHVENNFHQLDPQELLQLDNLPIELLEMIFNHLKPTDLNEVVRHINKRFRDVSRRVMFKMLRDIKPAIRNQLIEAKEKLLQLSVGDQLPTNLELEMVSVAHFTFLQIMYSEYKVVASIFKDDDDSSSHRNLIFFADKVILEFWRLLDGTARNEWNWRAGNVSTAMDRLRNLDSDLIELFIFKFWSPSELHFGPLLLKFYSCSICSKYVINVTHEARPKYTDSKCHVFGFYDIMDVSNTLSVPPTGLHDVPADRSLRTLAMYISNAVRWGNWFHTLRLRWVSMDRALALGRRHQPGWPILESFTPYLANPSSTSTERVEHLRNGEQKVIRIISKNEDIGLRPNPLGMRCEFHLWCPLIEAPQDLIDPTFINTLLDLSSLSPSCTRPYQFTMELKVFVREVRARHNVLETTIWVNESQDMVQISQSRQIVAT